MGAPVISASPSAFGVPLAPSRYPEVDPVRTSVASPRLWARRPQLFFAQLFGPGVEPGYGPIRLPKLHVVAVDEPPGGFDGGLINNAIQLNHANGSVV